MCVCYIKINKKVIYIFIYYGFYVIIKIIFKNLEIDKDPQRTYLNVLTILSYEWFFLP